MSDLQTIDVSVKDVYDFAYDIAQEFEKIVNIYGIDRIKPAVDKVINSLEILESCVKRIDQLKDELKDMKSSSLLLSSEKIFNENESSKLKQIYEEREESWLEEVINLKSEVSLLKSENQLLKSSLEDQKESSVISDDCCDEISDNGNIIYKLEHVIKEKEKQHQDNVSNISSLKSKTQELIEINKMLHLKNQDANKNVNKLILEKNDYKNESELLKKENSLLKEFIEEMINSTLSAQEGSNKCLQENSCSYTFEDTLVEDLGGHQNKDQVFPEKIRRLQRELQNVKSKSQQCEENLKLFSSENKVPFSKIQNCFHLFLGVTTIPGFC